MDKVMCGLWIAFSVGCASELPVPVEENTVLEEGAVGSCDSTSSYDDLVLCDAPVAFWAVDRTSGSEPDLTGNDHDGTYEGGRRTRTTAQLPNDDVAIEFDGAGQYLAIDSSADFSIPTTGRLTWEAWIRPSTLDFPDDDGTDGYVDWMGKCQDYGGSCEWESRMYKTTTEEGRPNRISAYVFNRGAGLGSAADWQPARGEIRAGDWLHVVGEYSTAAADTPSGCPDKARFPGGINIWVNGVKWSQPDHNPTGCMSQYQIRPSAANSPLNIGTMSFESFFKGAIGKVAIYDKLLTQAQISAHYRAMTGENPTGRCGDDCAF
jgi:hypothetical protein